MRRTDSDAAPRALSADLCAQPNIALAKCSTMRAWQSTPPARALPERVVPAGDHREARERDRLGRSPPESSARRAAAERLRAPRARTSKLIPMKLGDVLYESGIAAALRLFPDDVHRVAALRDGGRRLRRDRDRGQRRHPRHFAVHGRRHHAQPRRRAERGVRLPAQGRIAQERVRPLRPDDAPAAALHPGADHADGADGGVQPASFGRPAVVPVAAAEPRPPGVERALDDAGTDRQHAGRAPRGRHRGRRQAAGRGV